MNIRRLLGIVVLGMGFLVGVPTAQATDEAALSTMPRGLSLEDVFNVPALSGGLANSVQTVQSTNPSSATTGIQLTDAPKQVGVTWSTPEHQLNLSRDFTMSMWLYFGNQGNAAEDGMAFVLQNTGPTAVTAGLSAKTMPGQTLGVWGLDNDGHADNKRIASGAIQNSWALEFDEFVNDKKISGQNGGFDTLPQIKGPHLASGYPGDSRSYVYHNDYHDQFYHSLVHNGLINTTLSDGQWHHLTLTWTAPQLSKYNWLRPGKMQYTFDDKDSQTGATLTGKSATVDVDHKRLGLTRSTIKTTPVWWGFTSSTGAQYANNIVVLESLPEQVDGETTLAVKNKTQNQDVSTGGTIRGNDELSYYYHLKYNAGNADWKNIKTNLSQTPHVAFSKGQIVYGNGQTEELSQDKLAHPTAIVHTLAHNLGASNPSATLTLTGKAADVAAQTKVTAMTQYLDGSNYLSSVTTPDFTIQPLRQLTLKLAGDNPKTVTATDSFRLAGTLAADKAFVGDVTIHAALNGAPLSKLKLNEIDQQTGRFTLELAASQLKMGANQVSFYATDQAGNRSNVASTTVTLAGELSFGPITEQVNFGEHMITFKSQLVAATSDWVVDINDLRAPGAKWYLYAKACVLTSAEHALAGGLVYLDASGNRLNMTENATLVASGDSGQGETQHAGQQWSQSQGIFLDVQPSARPGSYTGKITWSLADAPQ